MIRNHERPELDFSNMPLMLDEKDTAIFLGVSVSFLRKSRSEGLVGGRTEAPPFVRVRGRVFYRVADLKAWVEALENRVAV